LGYGLGKSKSAALWLEESWEGIHRKRGDVTEILTEILGKNEAGRIYGDEGGGDSPFRNREKKEISKKRSSD